MRSGLAFAFPRKENREEEEIYVSLKYDGEALHDLLVVETQSTAGGVREEGQCVSNGPPFSFLRLPMSECERGDLIRFFSFSFFFFFFFSSPFLSPLCCKGFPSNGRYDT